MLAMLAYFVAYYVNRGLGALALGASICTLTVAAMAGTANAACFTVENVWYSAPHLGQATVPPAPTTPTCYINNIGSLDGIDCKLINPSTPTGPHPQWKTADVGSLIVGAQAARFANAAATANPALQQANIYLEPAAGSLCGFPTPTPNVTNVGNLGQTKRQVDVVGAGPVRVRIQDNIPAVGSSIYLTWY